MQFVGRSFASTLEEQVTYEHHDSRTADERLEAARMSRARLLRNTAAAAAVGLSPTLLSAGVRAGATTPKKGGALRVGFVGGGTAETLNPFIGVTPIDQGRIQNLYDPLVIIERRPVAQPGPRARVEREQGLHGLRGQAPPEGVEFHNGKSFGAEDVIYSIQQMAKQGAAPALPVRVEHQARRA